MTKGKKDEVPPIDIQDFVPFYKTMDKGNLQELYVDLQRKESALQEEKAALQRKESALEEGKTALLRKETALQEEKSALIISKAAAESKGTLKSI